MNPILLAHATATLFMVGLIWFVQVVHYPLLRRVGADGFREYAREHSNRTSWVVGPPMLVEALTGGLLVLSVPSGIDPRLPLAGLVLLAVVWISTAALQVPMHRRLSRGYDERACTVLVRTNWLRTVAWTLRGAIVLAMLR